mmetsp:Transcript_14541/g.16257  ORF Transcript_14541/g.16257 Transcript_14541/m.16257 type:complete len:303 (+) Transcript_14541:79-987(+)
MLEDRYTEIERENRILLEKMTSIMQKPNRTSTSFSQDRFSNYPGIITNKKSLNRAQRKHDLLKITLENQAILRRLQDKSSNYNVARWENQHMQRQGLLKNMSEYPDDYSSKNRKRLYNRSEAAGTSYRPHSLGPRQTWRNKNHTAKTAPIVKQAEALDENRLVHYKKGKQLGAGYYIVEISSSSSNLFIAAYDVESTESFLITLPDKRANELMVEFENNYELMASSLQVMNKRLYLLNPKYLADQKTNKDDQIEGQELGETVPQEGVEPIHTEENMDENEEMGEGEQDEEMNEEEQEKEEKE